MLTILEITNTLSLALHRKDQDIVNAIKCVKATKCQLDELRREKWVKILDDVHGFCDNNDICKLEMEDELLIQRSGGINLELRTSIIIK